MSETKHTPLPPTPWMRVFANELDPDLILVQASDASHVLLIRTATTQQRRALSYLLDSVNARPKVEELVRMVKKAAEVAASKQNRQEAAAVVLGLVLPHLSDKAREVEAALQGKAE